MIILSRAERQNVDTETVQFMFMTTHLFGANII